MRITETQFARASSITFMTFFNKDFLSFGLQFFETNRILLKVTLKYISSPRHLFFKIFNSLVACREPVKLRIVQTFVFLPLELKNKT